MAAATGCGKSGAGRLAIDGAVHVRIADNDLDVLASFREGYGLDEFGNFGVVAFGCPERDAVFTGIVSRSGIFGAAGGAREIGDIEHAEFDVGVGVEERVLGVADLELFREQAAGLRENLH